MGTQELQARAQKMGIDTVFDRAFSMKPCAIGIQGICCKNCSMGPCRLPLPKSGIEGEDTRKGLCGATPNTIAARNFIRMIAGGASAHSDHGRCVAEVFLSAARKETEAYKIKDTQKLLSIAPIWVLRQPLRWTEKPKTEIWMKSPLKWPMLPSENGENRKVSCYI